jgi:pilus assembly protein TadC
MAQGEPIPAAWQRGIAETAQTAPLLRALCRSDTSGAALAGTCRRLADQLREHAQAQAAVTAGRSAVLMIAPLMCCFLPAFVLLGVVPVVVSVLSQALGVAL